MMPNEHPQLLEEAAGVPVGPLPHHSASSKLYNATPLHLDWPLRRGQIPELPLLRSALARNLD
jgi:hypothetical protein